MEVPKRSNETAFQRFKSETLSVAEPPKPKPKPTYSVSAFPVRNAPRTDVHGCARLRTLDTLRAHFSQSRPGHKMVSKTLHFRFVFISSPFGIVFGLIFEFILDFWIDFW